MFGIFVLFDSWMFFTSPPCLFEEAAWKSTLRIFKSKDSFDRLEDTGKNKRCAFLSFLLAMLGLRGTSSKCEATFKAGLVFTGETWMTRAQGLD